MLFHNAQLSFRGRILSVASLILAAAFTFIGCASLNPCPPYQGQVLFGQTGDGAG